jgi:photosystem II stability/assembly factor-like uncharacterized protein
MIGNVQFVSSTEGWISGSRGDLLHTTDAGANWMVVTPFPNDTVWSTSDPAVCMSWVNSTHGWKINSFGPSYGTSYGVVVHQTTDGGNTWQKKVLSNVAGDFGFKIQFVDVNNGWLLYFNFSTQVATFLKTTDGGNNWIPFNGAGIFYFVDANVGWSYYGSGQNGADPPFKILRTTNGGTDWTEQFSDNSIGGYNAIYFSDVNNGWIVGDAGKVIKTTDSGANWNFVTNSGINSNNRSKAVFFLDANNGWVSSKDNANNPYIQHTTDGGASWDTQFTPFSDPNGYNAIFSIFFINTQTGWITGDYGRIAKYTGTTGIEDKNYEPNDFCLMQNYPNPFNPDTRISWITPVSGWQTLKVFNILGIEVATLIDEYKSAGRYEADFDASSTTGGLTSGVYFYQLKAGNYLATQKMILMK